MVDFYDIACPYCGSKKYEIDEDSESDADEIEYLDDEEEAVCRCNKCKKLFLVITSIEAIKSIDYETKTILDITEFIDYEMKTMVQPEDILKDCMGQLFLWEDLQPSGIKIY